MARYISRPFTALTPSLQAEGWSEAGKPLDSCRGLYSQNRTIRYAKNLISIMLYMTTAIFRNMDHDLGSS